MSKNLAISFIFSALLHGLVLMGARTWMIHDKKVFSKKQGEAAIKVRLSVYQKAQPLKPTLSSAAKGKRPEKVSKKTVQKTQSSKSKVKQTKGSDELLAKYLSQVREAILRHKIKLRMAKRLRLKGDVGLYFLLKKPNIIEGVRVLKSSTFPQLDQSALATLDAVDNIPTMPEQLKLNQIPITVVISYQ